MTQQVQDELDAVREWARAQGRAVPDSGALPPALLRAFSSAHAAPAEGDPPRAQKESPVAATPRRRPSAPARAAAAAPADPVVGSRAPRVDLAGSLRGLLAAVDDEVAAVGELSERIDEHVTALNALRAEQAERLEVLDELRASVADESLGAFLDKAVRPRGARVEEVVPERLLQD